MKKILAILILPIFLCDCAHSRPVPIEASEIHLYGPIIVPHTLNILGSYISLGLPDSENSTINLYFYRTSDDDNAALSWSTVTDRFSLIKSVDGGDYANLTMATLLAEGVDVTGVPTGATTADAPLLVNPASAGANEYLLAVLLNSASRFSVDEDGDGVFAGSLATGGALTVDGNLWINGTEIRLDTDNVGAGVSSMVSFNRGSTAEDAAILWDETADVFRLYADNDAPAYAALWVQELNVAATGITLDADNAGAGATSGVGFNRGSTATDASVTWDETSDAFRLYMNEEGDHAELNVGQMVAQAVPSGAGIADAPMYINPASANANEYLAAVALNGSSRLSVDEDGDTVVAGTFVAGGSITSGGNLSVNGPEIMLDADNAGVAVSQQIYFNRGSTGESASLLWDETADEFQLLEDESSGLAHVRVGDLTAEGELEGARLLLAFGKGDPATADHYLTGPGGFALSAQIGIPTSRAGSIVSIAGIGNITDEGGAGGTADTFKWCARVNGVAVFCTDDITLNVTEVVRESKTQARGVDVFAAEDLITAHCDITADEIVEIESQIVMIEIVYDN